MGATPTSITNFLNTALARAGWQAWNPQTENAHGCGTEPNDFWKWSKSGVAVGWNAQTSASPYTGLPFWLLAFCDLAYGSSN
jgi:hypothetical protein